MRYPRNRKTDTAICSSHVDSSFKFSNLYVQLGVHVEARKLEIGHDGSDLKDRKVNQIGGRGTSLSPVLERQRQVDL